MSFDGYLRANSPKRVPTDDWEKYLKESDSDDRLHH
jgi:hypothetical protein